MIVSGRKASSSDDDEDSPSAPSQHMADIVQAAMDATRARDQGQLDRLDRSDIH